MRNLKVTVGAKEFEVEVCSRRGSEVTFLVDGEQYRVEVSPALEARPSSDEGRRPAPPPPKNAVPRAAKKAGDLSAPMPGVVAQVLVREGDEVALGQPLLVIEAMKMENTIPSPRSGTVCRVRVNPGDHVEHGQLLLQME